MPLASGFTVFFLTTVHPIPSPRLILAPTTLELIEADRLGPETLARALDATVPLSWPPEYFDPPARDWSERYLREHPGTEGWLFWYLLLRDSRTLIGITGFKGAPAADGTAEIGYSVLPEHRGQGYAPEAVRTLLHWAFTDPHVRRVVAETYPELSPSIRVLAKNHFRFEGVGSEERVIRFELTRGAFQASLSLTPADS